MRELLCASLCWGLLGLSLGAGAQGAEPPVFEDLGVVVRHDPAYRHQYLFVDVNGREISWGARFSGFFLDTGEPAGPSLRELSDKYGESKLRIMTLGADGNMYLYYGVPSHFFRYDPYRQILTDLGAPDEKARYYLSDSGAISDQGVFYVGTYPRASLVSCDTRTGAVKLEALLSKDERQHYITAISVNAAGTVFAYVGKHHSELVAYDPPTGRLKQLLPEALQTAGDAVHFVRAEDGQVYASTAGRNFICRFEGLEETGAIPRPMPGKKGPNTLANGHKVRVELERGDRLQVHDLDEDRRREVRVNLASEESDVFCLGVESGERIYGGANHPANVFYYDRSKNAMGHFDLSLGVQTYAIAQASGALYFTTYTGGQIYRLDPAQPIVKGKNPARVAKLSDEHEQERLYELVLARDGGLYVPSVPTKGQLGGALTRFDPVTFECKVYRGIIPSQSIVSLAAVPETGEIFGTSDVRGGTSAHATEREGVIFVWDPKSESVVYQSRPVPGAPGYRDAVRAENGIVYFRTRKAILAFDPVAREIVARSEAPVEIHLLCPQSVGAKKKIVGIGDGAIVAIDPADHQCRVVARHESLRGKPINRGVFVDSGLNLYYGKGSHLWRCRLSTLD